MPVVRLMTDVSSAPPPVVAAALDGLAERLRLAGGVPPVWVQPMPKGLNGQCPWDDHTEGEIFLSPRVAGLEQPDSAALARSAQEIVIHEISHRLLYQAARQMPDADNSAADDHAQGHNAAFVAVRLLLLLRAGDGAAGDPAWWAADLYDLHDHANDDLIGPGQALGWAWKLAHELAPTDWAAEACAQEILQKYIHWRGRLEGASARARKQRLAQARAQEAARALKRRLVIAAASGWVLAGVLLWARP